MRQNRRGHRGSIGGGGRGKARGRINPVPELIPSDGLPPQCRRCRRLGRHVPMCVGCALIRAGIDTDDKDGE